ncbi:hypothetical protein [Flintibacter muris]|uniref:hypothetical protein n=1 Tax=Flintibacter muris TaxID=2941327 RepID=UPI00203CB77B|nr:hypothetical protein [Flintibacter muris]
MTSVLGWYQFPEPEGTGYTEDMLRDPAWVEELFNYCQIWYAVIAKEGWDFLLRTYGLEELYRIDRRSGWHNSTSLEDFASDIDCERSAAPDRL